jgi:hypothetical protein
MNGIMRTITTRSGKSVTTDLTDIAAMKRLVELVEARKVYSQFALDLAYKIRNQRPISPEQIKWVVVLVADYDNRPAPVARWEPIMLPHIAIMIERAKEKLKGPRLTLQGVSIKVMHPMAGRGRGGRTWVWGPKPGDSWGELEADGRWVPPTTCPKEIVELLIQFNADPAGVAKLHGTSTGCCCFCARELTTAESVSVGYGPICADRFGLPWGPTVVATQIEKARRLADKIAAEKLLQGE